MYDQLKEDLKWDLRYDLHQDLKRDLKTDLKWDLQEELTQDLRQDLELEILKLRRELKCRELEQLRSPFGKDDKWWEEPWCWAISSYGCGLLGWLLYCACSSSRAQEQGVTISGKEIFICQVISPHFTVHW
jgi:hypothetical protein